MREQTRLNAESLTPVSSPVHWHDFGCNRPHGADNPSSPDTAERSRQDQPCDGLGESKREIIKHEMTGVRSPRMHHLGESQYKR